MFVRSAYISSICDGRMGESAEWQQRRAAIEAQKVQGEMDDFMAQLQVTVTPYSSNVPLSVGLQRLETENEGLQKLLADQAAGQSPLDSTQALVAWLGPSSILITPISFGGSLTLPNARYKLSTATISARNCVLGDCSCMVSVNPAWFSLDALLLCPSTVSNCKLSILIFRSVDIENREDSRGLLLFAEDRIAGQDISGVGYIPPQTSEMIYH